MIKVGSSYFFQSVTHNYIGKVAAISPAFIECSECAYVFETGPYAEFFANQIKNKERVADGTLIPVGALTAVMPWPHPVPGDPLPAAKAKPKRS